MARWQFLMKILWSYVEGTDKSCPYCLSLNTKRIGNKWFVLQLRRCEKCKLMFRYPKDSQQSNLSFYQRIYTENGLTAELPDDSILASLLKTAFAGSDRDFSEKIRLVRSLKPAGRVLDYGCSWGYGVWQFNHHGYEAVGFEISSPRAVYGREKLNVQILDSFSELDTLPENSFDIIFSNHVLEHLPSLKDVFRQFQHWLSEDGVLVIFVPNATGVEESQIFERKKSSAFGEKHTMALDHVFFEHNLPQEGFEVHCFSTPPYALSRSAVEGDELLVVGRKKL